MKQTVSAILVLLLILSGCAAVQLSVATTVPGTTRSDPNCHDPNATDDPGAFLIAKPKFCLNYYLCWSK